MERTCQQCGGPIAKDKRKYCGPACMSHAKAKIDPLSTTKVLTVRLTGHQHAMLCGQAVECKKSIEEMVRDRLFGNGADQGIAIEQHGVVLHRR